MPQHRQRGEMVEETCGQEDGRENMHGRGCSVPKGCMPESLQPMDNPHQGRDTLTVAMGDLCQHSDTGQPGGVEETS